VRPVVDTELENIEKWAQDNEREARQDRVNFWLLKAPAIILSAVSGLGAAIGDAKVLVIVVSTLAGVCVLIDGVVRPGRMRSVHWRAFSDLRLLQNRIESQWTSSILDGADPDKATSEVIKLADKEKERIGKYLAEIESSGPETTSGKS
jgi:hypothetical protein